MQRTLRLTVLVALLAPVTAAAHDLGAHAKRKDGRVHVQAYFDDNKPARNAQVTVIDATDKRIATGRTDAEGRWFFPAPPPGNYSLVVELDDGHRAETTLTIPDGNADADVSTGPPRDEFTRPRWIGLGIGIVLIAAVVIISRLYLRKQNAA